MRSTRRVTDFVARVLVCALGALALVCSPAFAKSIVVPRDFPTIQAAVDAAAPGDAISVGSGTYTEQVVIAKDLDLIGSGAGSTSIKAPATLTPYGTNVANGTLNSAIVQVGHGAHVRISRLTVSGPIPCGVVAGVAALQSAMLELSNARVTGMRPAAAVCPGPIRGVGVVFGEPSFVETDGVLGSTASGRVALVVIDGYQTSGLVATGPLGVPPTRVTFALNLLAGGSTQIPTGQIGINVFDGAVAQVIGNRLRDNFCTIPPCGPDPINQVQSMGIYIGPAVAGSTIAGNLISGSDVGIYSYQFAARDCCTISRNTLLGNRDFGIALQDGNGAASDNRIFGGQVGIGVVAVATDTVAVLRGNRIFGSSLEPVREIECCGFSATAIVNQR